MTATAIGGAKARCGGAPVKQVTKLNFATALRQIKADIEDADFIAVSTRKTGDSSSSSSHRYPWRRILPIDTPEIAYLKSKVAAESFELLQFAVCPFSIRGSKVFAYPYNFHLFPRDELNLGIPAYSFSCQSSFLASMAREGFDFNACIYDGISYLSRVQEAKARERFPRSWMRSATLSVTLPQNPSVADSIFKERIKSRVSLWRKACIGTNQAKDGCLVQSLRKLVLGGEAYGSRPSMSVDVCSEKQVELVFEMVKLISDDLVPIVSPAIGRQPEVVRIVLTSSGEDKNALLTELQNLEEEQNLKVRGFREVIDLISISQKPVVSDNCLHDFTFIHEKFMSPLPATLPEFLCSLRLLFSNVIDLNHLLKEIAPLSKAKNTSSALTYLKRRFFVPIELKVPQDAEDGNKSHGSNVLKIVSLFARLNMLLKTDPGGGTTLKHTGPIEDYANMFHSVPMSINELGDDDDVGWWMDPTRRVSTDNIIFLWGFGGANSVADLKQCLLQIHPALSQEFDVHFLDKSCAVVVFRSPSSAEILLKEMTSVEISGVLKEIVLEELRSSGYDAYKKVCRLGLWEGNLADSLEIALADPIEDLCTLPRTTTNEIYWNSEFMIHLNDLQ